MILPAEAGEGGTVPSQRQDNRQHMRLAIRVATIIKLLAGIAVIFVVLSYSGQLAVRAFDWHPERDIVQFFNIDRERNLPTTFQALLFLGSALSLTGIAIMRRLEGDRWTRHWALLALVFLLLAWDEIVEIHERFIEPLRRAFDLQGIFFFGWIIPAGIAVLLLCAAYLRFMLALEHRTRNLLIAAAVLFLSGAIIMEGIGGWYYDRIDQATNMVYVSMATFEESLESAGLILFVYAMLSYLSRILPRGKIEISGEPGRIWVEAAQHEEKPG